MCVFVCVLQSVAYLDRSVCKCVCVCAAERRLPGQVSVCVRVIITFAKTHFTSHMQERLQPRGLALSATDSRKRRAEAESEHPAKQRRTEGGNVERAKEDAERRERMHVQEQRQERERTAALERQKDESRIVRAAPKPAAMTTRGAKTPSAGPARQVSHYPYFFLHLLLHPDVYSNCCSGHSGGEDCRTQQWPEGSYFCCAPAGPGTSRHDVLSGVS